MSEATVRKVCRGCLLSETSAAEGATAGSPLPI
jgi:hypothetical protein